MVQDQKNQKEDRGEVFFNWTFSEFPKYERSGSWYFGATVLVIILLIYALFSANFLFAVIIIVSSLVILMFQRSDNKIDFKITEDGIVVGKQFYDYADVKNFYIIYQPPTVKTLYFERKGTLRPRIPIQLEDQNPVKIRETLLNYLQEDLDHENEPTSDQLSRRFKL